MLIGVRRLNGDLKLNFLIGKTREAPKSLLIYIINYIINQIKVLDYREHLKDPLNQADPKVSLRFHFLPICIYIVHRIFQINFPICELFISDKFPHPYTVYLKSISPSVYFIFYIDFPICILYILDKFPHLYTVYFR